MTLPLHAIRLVGRLAASVFAAAVAWSTLALAAPVEVDPAVSAAENARIRVMDRAKDAVLAVFAASGRGGGSGVVISPDGFALTNFHVTKPSGDWVRCGMADGKVYDAVLVGLDPTGDVALIKLFGRNDFPAAPLGDSDQVQPGDWAFAMGNPFLLATDFQPTVTYGIISGTHRYQYPSGTLLEYTDCLQTDAAVNPGNSGGPLFDAQGRLIGINGRCSFEKRGRVSVGVGYAISINQIKNFLGHLRSGRIVDHATLGATVASDDDGRALVNEVLESSDAARNGLQRGDEITQLAGRPIHNANTLKNILGIFPKGWRVPLVFRREGKRHEILVRLEGLHDPTDLLAKLEGRPPRPQGPPDPGKTPKPGQPTPKPGEKGPNLDDLKNLPKKLKDLMPGRKRGPHPPMPPHAAPVPMPETVKKHFEKRRGYANYFHNRQEQDRVWRAWTDRMRLASPKGQWTLAGKTAGGKPFRFELTDAGVTADLPEGKLTWTPGDDLTKKLAPPHSGGLMPALYLWRRLATAGLKEFGEVYYLGTAPLPGREGLVDVLVAALGGVECHFFFDPNDGRLLAIEMFPDKGADPCEITFPEDRRVGEGQLPARMEVHFARQRYGAFVIETFDVKQDPPR